MLFLSASLFAGPQASHPTSVDVEPAYDRRRRLTGEAPALPAKSDVKEWARDRVFDAYTYSDWNAPNITCLFHLLGK